MEAALNLALSIAASSYQSAYSYGTMTVICHRQELAGQVDTR
ncbi:hypothetical protein DFR38_11648 [Aquitalea magnusonii]|uniref:Uncharacterized protein n=1 Tax=Aquitalea magnusonii TaxID=332411 RepID=A0A318J736_9NEIS|nr:hypothetical protein DFR38_11648 [Aquitalea magnusonii]